MLRRFSVMLAALASFACESPPKADATPSKQATPDAKDPAEVPEAAQPTAKPEAAAVPVPKPQLAAPLTLAIHPARWSALHSVSMPLLAKLPDDVEPLRKASSPEATSALIVSAVFGVAPPEIRGWDTSRPILIALGETDHAGVAGATVGQLPLVEQWVPGIRHQAVIPATDPTALLETLTKLFSPEDKPLTQLSKDHPGAVAMRFDEWSVVLLPAPEAVRIVVFEEYVGLAEDKAFAHMRKRLDTPIHVTTSAAADVLKDDGAVFAAWFRPDRLRSLAVTYGAGQLFAAVASAPPDVTGQLIATGMGTLIASDALMVDEGAEVDEVGLTLRVEGSALRLQQLAVLSDEGEKAFAAATKDVGTTFGTASDPVWADLVVRANIRALLDAVQPPPFAGVGENPDAVREAIFEGGYFTLLHLGTRHGLGLTRFAELATGSLPLPTDTTPTAAHVVWTGMNKDETPKVAAALHWPKAHDLSGLTTVLQEIAKDPDFASLKVTTTDHEGSPTHVMGLGGLFKKAFTMDAASPVNAIIDLRANVPALVAAAADGEPEVAEWFSETSEMRFTLRHESHALIGDLAWSPSGGTLELKPATVLKSGGSPGLVGNPANTEAELCIGKAAFAYAGALRAVALVSPESLGAIATKGLAEAGESVTCAEAEPKAKAAVESLRRVAVSTLLDAVPDATVKASIRKQQCALDTEATFCKAATPGAGE